MKKMKNYFYLAIIMLNSSLLIAQDPTDGAAPPPSVSTSEYIPWLFIAAIALFWMVSKVKMVKKPSSN